MAQRQTGGRARAGFFLMISAAAAVLAVVLIYRLIQSYQQELVLASKPEETIPVVVAKHTLNQGQTLGELDLEVKEVVPAFVPDTVFHAVQEVVGRVPGERIIIGEYVRRERLADPEAGVGLNALIPKGQRALSLNLSDGSAVSGFLNPGNYVDVLITLAQTEGKDAGVIQTVTLFQAKRILAVNSRLGAGDLDGPARDGAVHAPSITLALTPDEAEKMTHAYSSGSVTMTLRNDVDVTQVTTNGARANKIVGKTDAPVVEFTKVIPRKREKPVVTEEQRLQIIRGSSESTGTYRVPQGGQQ
jgi:pilus assembly protein CpaB